MNIALVVPPFCEEGLEMTSKESIGVCYLSAGLRRQGFSASIIEADLLQLSLEETMKRITAFQPDIVGFSMLEGTIESALTIIQGIRQQGFRGHITAGGYLPTLITEELLENEEGIDSVIRGEGETIIAELAGKIAAGKDWRCISGIAYRAGAKAVVNGNSPASALDEIVFPCRDLLPEVVSRGGTAGVVGSRGCFADCSFCCVNSFNAQCGIPKWRGRSPENIVDEIELLKKTWGITTIAFYDSNFVGPGRAGTRRAYAIAEEILRRGLDINFAFSTRPDQVEEDLFGFLKRAGLVEVFIGLESMSQPSLDLYNKNVTVAQNRRAIEILERLELHYRPGFILYQPFITLEHIRENIEFMSRLIDSRYCGKYYFFKGLRVYRGSPLEEQLTEKNVLFKNGWHNGYTWQDPQVRKFIALTHAIGSKMAPMLERAKNLPPAGRDGINHLLGKWSVRVYGEILELIEGSTGDSDTVVDFVLREERSLNRIETMIPLVS